jgi:NAD(P)-dependent dehydrogenase (short-subunit alcohol dehydrogenase family)
MIIETGTLPQDALAGRVAVVTGAGGGIGYQAARSLCRLGARVVIAERNRRTGRRAAQRLRQDFGPEAARFVHTDVGRARSIRRLASRAARAYVKDPAQRAEQLRIVAGWRDEVEALRALLAGDGTAHDTEQ